MYWSRVTFVYPSDGPRQAEKGLGCPCTGRGGRSVRSPGPRAFRGTGAVLGPRSRGRCGPRPPPRTAVSLSIIFASISASISASRRCARPSPLPHHFSHLRAGARQARGGLSHQQTSCGFARARGVAPVTICQRAAPAPGGGPPPPSPSLFVSFRDSVGGQKGSGFLGSRWGLSSLREGAGGPPGKPRPLYVSPMRYYVHRAA